MRLRDELRRVEAPQDAQERAWDVVRGAFAEREPVPRQRHYVRPAVALGIAAAIVAGAVSSPGRAVLGDLRDEVVGQRNAAPALFSLPAPGRLIVYSTAGPWIVQRDGSKRLLDRYDEVSWSPHGKYVAATRRHELFALEPDGDVQWSLARTGRISVPQWGGTAQDTRIAYLAAGPNLRVVGGDGKGDRVLARRVARAAPAWLPHSDRHLLAFADRRGGIHLVDVERPAPLRPAPPGEVPLELTWVADGSYLLALGERSLRILRPDRRLVRTIRLPQGPHALAVSPTSHSFALTRRFGPDRSELLVFDAARPHRAPRRLFAATGQFTGLEWSPDGRWLLLAWPTADQWLFIRPSGPPKTQAVARVAEQFASGDGAPVFPALGGWCCARP
ncbi:MAG: hypothetical protein M3540_13440 [Actinomycetota bacterium]|nr:hypothetical protein [Actinomycetota bacterium]